MCWREFKFLFIFMLLWGQEPASASFNQLYREFIGSNKRLKNNLSRIMLTEEDKNRLEATHSWRLSGGPSYADNKTDSSSFSNSQQVKTQLFELSINRSVPWGGQFSLSNSFQRTDRSRWQSFVLGNNPVKISEFGQTLSYTQNLWKDFLGRNYTAELAIAEMNIAQARHQATQKNDDQQLEFFNDYMQAKLSVTLLQLQHEALKRARRRWNNISKRVRDGLNDRVDLYQAEANFIGQQEALEEARVNIKKSLERLGDHLHREVARKEIKQLALEQKVTFKQIQGNVEGNADLKILKQRLQIIQKRLEQVEYSLRPDLALTGAVSSNDFDAQSGKTFEKGHLLEKQKEVSLSLNLSLPLGFYAEKAQRRKESVNRLIAQRDLQSLTTKLQLQEQTINHQLKGLDENIRLAQKRWELSKKRLIRQNHLYNLGRTDLDRLINAEEDLIQTERSLVSYLANYYKVEALYASLYGAIAQFLLEFSDQK